MSTSPFILYADCEVIYDGRARSYLGRGNYLIIYKTDNSLLIHGADSIVPRNYQGPGTKVEFLNDKIIAKRKSETITINIHSKIHHFDAYDWSTQKIIITGTEKDLVDKLETQIADYVDTPINRVIREYKTEFGSIDLLVITNDDLHHIFEVKRKKATISAVSQVGRYVDCLVSEQKPCKGYLVAPEFGETAKTLSERRNINLIPFAF